MKKISRRVWGLIFIAILLGAGGYGYAADLFGLRTRWAESLSEEKTRDSYRAGYP